MNSLRRCLIVLLVASPWATVIGAAANNEAAERAAIQSVLDAHGAAWTKGDARAATSILTEDADWVTGSGRVFHGRAAIEKYHEEQLSGPAKGTRHSHPGTAEIRFIRPDVAIVDGDAYVEGMRDASGKELPGETGRYTAIFVKEKGHWKVTAFRLLPQLQGQTK